jgi:hypothetical protein
MSHKVFVSARFQERLRACDFVQRLCTEKPIICPCQWFRSRKDDDALSGVAARLLVHGVREAIRDCDFFVHLHYSGVQRGGNLVELGMAIAFDKKIIIVEAPAGRRAVFHEFEQMHRVRSDEDAIRAIWTLVKGKTKSQFPEMAAVVGYVPGLQTK